MKRMSPNHILSKGEEEKIVKEQIEKVLREHNLTENVDILYQIIVEYRCSTNEHIEECIEHVLEEYRSKIEEENTFVNLNAK